MTFGTFKSFNSVVFAGRDNNQVGDVLMGIYCGVKKNDNGTDLYTFLDEKNEFKETIIYGNVSIANAISGKAWDESAKKMVVKNKPIVSGTRVAIQLAARRPSTKDDKCGPGKTIVRYAIQCDPSYKLDPALKPLIAAAMAEEAPISRIVESKSFGTFDGSEDATDEPAAVPQKPVQSFTTKKPSPF